MADVARRPADHAAHDLELVARAAAGDLAASEAIAGRNLLAVCPTCAALATDLRSLAAATRSLPDAATRSERLPAPRDFRLSAADAARLRPSGLRGFARWLAGAGLGGSFGGRAQGFGGALVSLGLVGLLVSAGVPAFFGGAGGAAIELGSSPPRDHPSPPTVRGPMASALVAVSSSDDAGRTGAVDRDAAPLPTSPWATVTAASIIVATAGLALLAIGWRGRRTRADGT